MERAVCECEHPKAVHIITEAGALCVGGHYEEPCDCGEFRPVAK